MREAALLQSFPQNYAFDVSAGKEAVALMIGNALPPEFVRRHALRVFHSLKDQDRFAAEAANGESIKRKKSTKPSK